MRPVFCGKNAAILEAKLSGLRTQLISFDKVERESLGRRERKSGEKRERKGDDDYAREQ